MYHSSGRSRTAEKADALYNEWVETELSNQLFAEQHDMTWDRMKRLFTDAGFPVLQVKTAVSALREAVF